MEKVYCNSNVWIDRASYEAAECKYYQKLGQSVSNGPVKKTSLAGEVAKAREHIKQSLENVRDLQLSTDGCSKLTGKCQGIEDELKYVKKELELLKISVTNIQGAVKEICEKLSISVSANVYEKSLKKPVEIENDDVDLFGSDSEEDEAAQKLKEQRVAEYAARKSKKPALIAKSNIILDVKPWDDETDMNELEKSVRSVEMDGLLWGASKLAPLAYGIMKLQISCIVEDEKVSVDDIQEKLEEFDNLIQSVDVVAFNKV